MSTIDAKGHKEPASLSSYLQELRLAPSNSVGLQSYSSLTYQDTQTDPANIYYNEEAVEGRLCLGRGRGLDKSPGLLHLFADVIAGIIRGTYLKGNNK